MTVDHPIVKAFVDAAVQTLTTMAMLELEPGEVTQVKAFENTLDYTATMGLCGEKEGILVLSLESSLARQIVAAMLGEDESEIDSDLLDGVGELTNMIAGSAKTELGRSSYHFNLSIPAVIEGEKSIVTPPVCLERGASLDDLRRSPIRHRNLDPRPVRQLAHSCSLRMKYRGSGFCAAETP